MTSTATGREAEKAVAEYIKSEYGFKILDMNWRTRYCEIDIVAESRNGLINRSKTVHFIEVKYRRNSTQGDGLEAITTTKLNQMHKAAEMWVHEHDWDQDYQLDVVSATGDSSNWQFDVRLNVYL